MTVQYKQAFYMYCCYTGSPSEEVPQVWVDRAGAKLGLHQKRSYNSQTTYGVVLEEITTRDENGHMVAVGTKSGPSGNQAAEGPPTTVSSNGNDRVAFLQANVIRDRTTYERGTPLGARDQVTVGARCLSDALPSEQAVLLLGHCQCVGCGKNSLVRLTVKCHTQQPCQII